MSNMMMADHDESAREAHEAQQLAIFARYFSGDDGLNEAESLMRGGDREIEISYGVTVEKNGNGLTLTDIAGDSYHVSAPALVEHLEREVYPERFEAEDDLVLGDQSKASQSDNPFGEYKFPIQLERGADFANLPLDQDGSRKGEDLYDRKLAVAELRKHPSDTVVCVARTEYQLAGNMVRETYYHAESEHVTFWKADDLKTEIKDAREVAFAAMLEGKQIDNAEWQGKTAEPAKSAEPSIPAFLNRKGPDFSVAPPSKIDLVSAGERVPSRQPTANQTEALSR